MIEKIEVDGNLEERRSDRLQREPGDHRPHPVGGKQRRRCHVNEPADADHPAPAHHMHEHRGHKAGAEAQHRHRHIDEADNLGIADQREGAQGNDRHGKRPAGCLQREQRHEACLARLVDGAQRSG